MSAYMVNGTVSSQLSSFSGIITDDSRSHLPLRLSWQLPANNTVCEVDEDFEVFPGVNTQAILASLPDTIDFSL